MVRLWVKEWIVSSEKLFGIGYIGEIKFTICRLHFQLSEIMGQLTALLL